MLSTFFQALYLKIFINIVVKHSKMSIYVELLNHKGVVDTVHKNFDTAHVDESVYEFISFYTKETPFHYISILDTSQEQGAIPICSKNSISVFGDLSRSQYRCMDETWTYYTSKVDLKNLEKKYSRVGLDFVFSPFILLHHFFQDKIDTHRAMYVLIEDSYMSLCVFDNSELLFGQHLDVENYKQSDELMMEDEEDDEEHEVILNSQDDDDDDDTIDLDDIDSLEDLEDFADIEDLDTLEDMDEFAQTRDLEEEFMQEQKSKSSVDDSNSFNEDYQRFLLIQKAINHFYKDERFKSEFIETVYIADSIKVSRDFKKYLEEEMFLNVYVRQIDLGSEICEIAKLELK